MLTNHSKQLIHFLSRSSTTHSAAGHIYTSELFTSLYSDLTKAQKYVNLRTFTPQLRTNVPARMPPSYAYNSKSFPSDIVDHIASHLCHELTYSFSLLGRQIRLLFITSHESHELDPIQMQQTVTAMVMWLHMLHKYARNYCAKSLHVYIYLTELEKQLPAPTTESVLSAESVLSEVHINSAFTTACTSSSANGKQTKPSHIIIFRQEEWFKVFIHETIHVFGLDYSGFDGPQSDKQMLLQAFNVTSQVNAYEAYTEYWANIINIAFISYLLPRETSETHETKYMLLAHTLLQVEQQFALFQMIKVLGYMRLSYKMLISTTRKDRTQSMQLYRENTNVFAYYILRCILICNCEAFVQWCYNNNNNNTAATSNNATPANIPIQFNHTQQSVADFAQFIASHCNTAHMLSLVTHISELYRHTMPTFVLHTTRMTACELQLT